MYKYNYLQSNEFIFSNACVSLKKIIYKSTLKIYTKNANQLVLMTPGIQDDCSCFSKTIQFWGLGFPFIHLQL